MPKTMRTLPLATLLLAGAAQAATVEDPLQGWTDEYDLRQQAWDEAALAALQGTAPEALPPAHDETTLADALRPVLQPELSAAEALMGASAVPVRSTEPTLMKGCWYVASVEGLWRPGVGLRWLLTVSRLPSGGCVEQHEVIDSSYVAGPPVMIPVEHQGFALAFQSTQTPVGPTHLRLYHVDPVDMRVVRQTLLGSPVGGDTRATELSLEGNRLLVHGTKGGPIPGEVGSGNRFVATYPRFFTSQDAPSLFAYPAPSGPVIVQTSGAAEVLTEEQLRHEEQARLAEAEALEALRASLAFAGEATPAEAPVEPEPPVVDDGLTERDALEYLRAHEPETLRALAARPNKVRGCWYFLASATEGWPPILVRHTLTRMPSRNCKGQTVTLGTTYSGWGLQAVARRSQGIAVAYQQKWTMSGSGLSHVAVLAVDPKTMAITRSTILGTWMGSTSLYGMAFDGPNLVVQTSRYTATFPEFLTSELPPQGVIFP